MKLEGKVAIVSGGARGNGFAAAKCMAEEGADIAIADICEDMKTIPYAMSTPESMAKAVDEIQADGAAIAPIHKTESARRMGVAFWSGAKDCKPE